MEVALRQQPSFSVARLSLSSGETVKVESGAMMAMSSSVVPEVLGMKPRALIARSSSTSCCLVKDFTMSSPGVAGVP